MGSAIPVLIDQGDTAARRGRASRIWERGLPGIGLRPCVRSFAPGVQDEADVLTARADWTRGRAVWPTALGADRGGEQAVLRRQVPPPRWPIAGVVETKRRTKAESWKAVSSAVEKGMRRVSPNPAWRPPDYREHPRPLCLGGNCIRPASCHCRTRIAPSAAASSCDSSSSASSSAHPPGPRTNDHGGAVRQRWSTRKDPTTIMHLGDWGRGLTPPALLTRKGDSLAVQGKPPEEARLISPMPRCSRAIELREQSRWRSGSHSQQESLPPSVTAAPVTIATINAASKHCAAVLGRIGQAPRISASGS